MSCKSTAISTRWTITTSNVPATGTVVHTSIITPKAQTSTSLLTSCLSTRRALSSGALQLSTKKTKRESYSKSSSGDTKENLVLDANTTEERHHQRQRQVKVPPGLLSNCISWTIEPVLSTASGTTSTSLGTSTIVTNTVTTVWVPAETIWGGCGSSSLASSSSVDGSSSRPIVTSLPGSESLSPVPTSSSSSSAETVPSSSDESSSTFAEVSISPSSSSDSGSASSSSASPSKEWIDETSKLNSIASVLASEGTLSTTLSATLTSNPSTLAPTTGTSQSIATTSEVEVPIAPIAITTISSPSPSSASKRPMMSDTSSAGSGAATQGAMAVDTGRDKAVSVGATIGGIIGLFGLIALILMGVRYYIRWKRGNSRKTILMRQSRYPAGYDGPDHTLPDSNEKDQDPSQYSFFSMNGKNAIAGGAGGDGGGESERRPKRFPGLAVPYVPNFFPYSKNNRDVLNDDNQDFSAQDAKPLTMPAILAGMRPNKTFPALWSSRKTPESPWEQYAEKPIGNSGRNRDVNPPRSIMTRSPGFDGVVGPPKLDYQPAQGHMSWGLQRPPVGGASGTISRPNLEWGHSYAASTVNPNPRCSVMPPLPPTSTQNRPFVPGPIIPPSPTEESVYSRQDSQHSGRDSSQSRQSMRSKQSFHSHRNRQSGQANLSLNRKPSRISNPDLRSVILSRALASAASLGNWSMHSGVSDRSIPALPEGGLRFDFPLPPDPSTRTPTMVSVPPPAPPKTGNRSLVPQRRPSDRKPAPNISSVFEHADYTRESTAGPVSVGREGVRDTIRQTADWYEQPWVWERQSGPLPRIPTDHGILGGSDWRQSQAQGQGWKSVKFDPAEGVARAL